MHTVVNKSTAEQKIDEKNQEGIHTGLEQPLDIINGSLS